MSRSKDSTRKPVKVKPAAKPKTKPAAKPKTKPAAKPKAKAKSAAKVRLKAKPDARPKQSEPANVSLPVIAWAITGSDAAGIPSWLGDAARAKWVEIHAVLDGRRLIDDRDRDALALYCDAWQQLSDAEQAIAENGEFFTTEKGYVAIHPAVLKRRKAIDVIRKLGEQLGLTPRARSNLAAANRPSKKDPLQQFLTKRP